MTENPGLVDRYGRRHTYMRVSVTDRCNFRCTYCMPADGLDWKPRSSLLSYEELERLIRIFVGLGVTRIRLTGGEPTIRADFLMLVRALGAIPGLEDLTLTTNAYRLPKLAAPMFEAGVRRINVSLDSLKPEVFSKLTRGAKLEKVLAGIEAARAAGMNPIKINAVIVGGENSDEVLELVEHFSPHAADTVLRFIEYMPFEARWHRSYTARQMRADIRARYTLETDPDAKIGAGPAVLWRVQETGLRVGFISPLSENFCGACNRLRLMADGHLRTCLSDDGTASLLDMLRGGLDDARIAAAIREMVSWKREGHGCTVESGAFEGVMTQIGG